MTTHFQYQRTNGCTNWISSITFVLKLKQIAFYFGSLFVSFVSFASSSIFPIFLIIIHSRCKDSDFILELKIAHRWYSSLFYADL